MRVDAAEFVPLAGASSAEDSWTQGSQPSTYTGAGVASGLSADSPAFVPGAQDVTSWHTSWEAWHASHDGYTPVEEYSTTVPECTETAPIVTYVDEETFLTPQLLDEMPEQAHSLPLSPKSGREAQDDGSLVDAPDKELECLQSQSHTSLSSSRAATVTTEEPSRHSELTGTGCAASSTCPSATTGCSAGVLSVHGRKLLWTLTGRDCQNCSDLYVLEEWPQGEGVESQRFTVAGVVLRLVFFPSGAALTGDGDCAVGLLSEDKAKLKFELFLNERRSGTKVMLGQKFSCDFRRPDFTSETDVITVGLEVSSNLFYFGFS